MVNHHKAFLLAVCFFVVPLMVHSFSEDRFYQIIESPPSWMLEQIDRDLSPYQKGIDEVALNKYFLLDRLGAIRIKIMNNNFSCEYHCDQRRDRRSAVCKCITYLTKIFDMPDVDIVLSLMDSIDYVYHRYSKSVNFVGVPILGFAKNMNQKGGVLFPNFEACSGWAFSGWSVRRIKGGQQNVTLEILKANTNYPWDKKKEIAFWRGNLSDIGTDIYHWEIYPRGQLVCMTEECPQLIDAKFTHHRVVLSMNPHFMQFVRENKLLVDYVAVFWHLQYKYLPDLDGSSCTFSRMYWILLSNSVLMKQQSPNIQWFSFAIEPYVHYVPFDDCQTDLINKIEWAKDHDDLCKQISLNATEFALNNLSEEAVYAYIYLLLEKYSALPRV